jgi:hypothetical protein
MLSTTQHASATEMHLQSEKTLFTPHFGDKEEADGDSKRAPMISSGPLDVFNSKFRVYG